MAELNEEVKDVVETTPEAEVEKTEEVESDILHSAIETDNKDKPSEEEVIALKNSDKAKWYALHTFTGYEDMVKSNLELVIDKYSLERRIFDIIIPEEEVLEEKNGKTKLVKRKKMPGYVLAKMIYGDDIWHAVTRTRGVTGFVGPKGRPLALEAEEVRRLKLEVVYVKLDLKIGDTVEVIYGPFEKQFGKVVSIDVAKQKVRVNLELFGKEMPVDLNLTDIRQI